MLDLETLTSGDLADLSRQAAEECERRLRRIAGASDPLDAALQELLRSMADEIHGQGRTLAEEHGLAPSGSQRCMAPDEVREFLRSAFPSLGKSLGEGTLHRDIALFYAESLEEEASRFHRMLAEHARESGSRSLFADLSDRERGTLHFLRGVVLLS